ncbi:hypothetical protein PMI40_04119 [Herbaspirillum sp. YR522]|nr:hypothetical protein PMI40_04119 [Herbaspirillum sp. YR522]
MQSYRGALHHATFFQIVSINTFGALHYLSKSNFTSPFLLTIQPWPHAEAASVLDVARPIKMAHRMVRH